MIKTTKTTNKQIKDMGEISIEQINQERTTVNIWQQLIRKLPHHIIFFVNFTCVRYISIQILLKSSLAGVMLNFLKFNTTPTKELFRRNCMLIYLTHVNLQKLLYGVATSLSIVARYFTVT